MGLWSVVAQALRQLVTVVPLSFFFLLRPHATPLGPWAQAVCANLFSDSGFYLKATTTTMLMGRCLPGHCEWKLAAHLGVTSYDLSDVQRQEGMMRRQLCQTLERTYS